MDTKWKSNKRSSFLLPVIAISAAASIFFMSLFPLFQKKAEESYIDPLTEQDFISDLFSINLVQYKYLREKADQKQYEYSDLYLDIEMPASDNPSDSYMDSSIQSFLALQREAINSQCTSYESMLSSLSEMMDYYVEDLNTGTVISNSGSGLPDAVGGEDSSDKQANSEYMYYLNLQYDSAGNITNVNVKCRNNAKQFLSRVQNAGHEFPLKLSKETPNEYSYSYDYDAEVNGRVAEYTLYSDDYETASSPTLRLSISSPADMRIIYGLTQAQYTELMKPDNYYVYMANFQSMHFAGRDSYFEAGIAPAYLAFILAMALAGFFLCRKKSLRSEELLPLISRIPLEFLTAAAVVLFSTTSLVIQYIYEYQNDLFLRNVRAGIGANGKLGILPLDKTVIFLMLTVIFIVSFLIGSGLSGFRKGFLKEHSLICKYWNRIVGKIRSLCHSFYTDLVTYDIGTDANSIIIKVILVNFAILLVICCFWFAGIFGLVIYSVIIYFILKRYVKDIQSKYRKLLGATRSIAQGNLDTALSEDFGIFESYKSQLRQIQMDFKRAVDEEVKSQRMKTELITNVSHDLKTPLTAIITYIELLREPDITEEKKTEYLDILQRKSNRLKVLIEDLFEISKASSKSVTLQIVDVDICNLLRQAYLEQDDRIEAAGLDFKFNLPEERIILPLDSQKTYRIFDNLYSNIIKYALSGTRVYVNLKDESDYVRVELKNISATELSVAPEELTERFVRGDDSRNTEGSGLGLAIAKSFAELQGGSMQIAIDGDLFKVILRFKKKAVSIQEEKPEQNNVLTGEGSTFSRQQMPYPVQNPQGYYGGPGTYNNPSAQNFYGGYPGMYGSAQGMPRTGNYGAGQEMPRTGYGAGRPINGSGYGAAPYNGPYNGGSYPGGGRMGTQPAPDTAWQNPRPPFSQEGMNSQPAAVPQEASEPKGSFFKKRIRKERKKNQTEEE